MKAIAIRTTATASAAMAQDPANRPEIEGYAPRLDRLEVLGNAYYGAFDAVVFASERKQALPTDYIRKQLDSLWTSSKRDPAVCPVAAFAEEAFEEVVKGFRRAQEQFYPNARVDYSSYRWENPHQPWLVF
ncbi:hypothetical protein IJH89_00565 [Candidatus Saccharibacteria bacterium]|nr:hypothetical protein [Candidatus Saccharibacteria bacterium]